MQSFNLTWIVLVCTALTLKAQAPTPMSELISTNKTVRSISLDECIRMALVRNLSIQLGRAEPEIARYVLSGSYGYYDPLFSGRAGDSYRRSPGGYNDIIQDNIPGSISRSDDFAANFNGILPSGARYGVSGTYGKSYGDNYNPSIPSFVPFPTTYRTDVRATVTQPLLRDFWTDAGRTTIKLAKKDVKISELALEYLIMQTLTDVALAYYDLISTRDSIKVQQQAVELAEQLAREEKRRVEVGTKAPLDEKQAESQAAQARANLIAAIFAAESAEDTLKNLITDNFVAMAGVALEPAEKLMAVFQSVNELQAWQNGLQFRPDYLQTKIDIEKANIRLQYRFNQLFPALDVEASAGLSGNANTRSDAFGQIASGDFYNYGAAVILSFPLTFRSERNTYKVAKVDKQTAILRLKQLEEGIVKDIDVAVKAIRSAYAATISAREASIFAAAALDAGQKKMENGKSTSFEVLQFQKNLTDARSSEIRALTAYNRALYQLYFREGTALQRMKINLDFK